MIREDMGKDPRGRELKGHLLWWLMSAAALAVAAFFASLALGSTTARAQVASASYSAIIDAPTADCGGGSIIVEVHDDAASIRLIGLTGFSADGTTFDALVGVLDPGAVPIADDGSFTTSSEATPGDDDLSPPNGGFTATVSGTFTDNRLDGTVNVSPSTCGDVPFSAVLPELEEPVPPPEGALVFEGHFEALFVSTNGLECGGGEIIVAVYPDRTSVFSFEMRGNTIGNIVFDAFDQFEPGEFPIDENATFSHLLFEEGGFDTLDEGAFDFEADPKTVTGTLTTFPAADPSVIICEEDYTAATAVLPTAGSGPAAGSDSGAVLWVVLAAALGAFGLATTGLAVMRRRAV